MLFHIILITCDDDNLESIHGTRSVLDSLCELSACMCGCNLLQSLNLSAETMSRNLAHLNARLEEYILLSPKFLEIKDERTLGRSAQICRPCDWTPRAQCTHVIYYCNAEHTNHTHRTLAKEDGQINILNIHRLVDCNLLLVECVGSRMNLSLTVKCCSAYMLLSLPSTWLTSFTNQSPPF